MSTAISQTAYNYKVVRQFAVMTVVWGVIGMGLGVLIAAQLVWPELNFDLPWTSFGRLRPLHTNAVIFAFGGCALFATSYYVVQRTSQARLISDTLAAFTFWGWQAVIVGAVLTLPQGFTTSKEYAELEWPLAILLAIVWITYAIVFFGTIVKRKVKHIYVGNWFYGAFILVTAMLHIVNHMSLPVSWFKSWAVQWDGLPCGPAHRAGAVRSVSLAQVVGTGGHGSFLPPATTAIVFNRPTKPSVLYPVDIDSQAAPGHDPPGNAADDAREAELEGVHQNSSFSIS